jgi:hypothetical protein
MKSVTWTDLAASIMKQINRLIAQFPRSCSQEAAFGCVNLTQNA